MQLIICGECDTGNYTITFQCDACPHLIDERDLVLEAGELWTVNENGTLGYIEEPTSVIAEMTLAIAEHTTTEPGYGKDSSRDAFFNALTRLRISLVNPLET